MFGHLALAVMLLESFAIANYAVAQTHAATPRTDFKVMNLRSLFPASHQVVGLIQASQPKDPSQPVVKGKLTPFLSVTDRISGSQNLIKLGLAFQPIKAAVFASGEFLVLGVEIANMLPVVAILNADGSLKKVLDIDPRDYAASEDLKKIHAVSPGDPSLVQLQRLILGSLNNAQFVPWGEQILLVQSGSTLPIYRFRDSGQLASVPVNLPDGSLLDTVLGSSDTDSWVLLTKDPASFQDIASGKVVENAPQSLFEVNPFTGEIIDQLVVTGPHPGEVHCAAHKRLTTTYYGLPQKQDVPDQLTYASAPR